MPNFIEPDFLVYADSHIITPRTAESIFSSLEILLEDQRDGLDDEDAFIWLPRIAHRYGIKNKNFFKKLLAEGDRMTSRITSGEELTSEFTENMAQQVLLHFAVVEAQSMAEDFDMPESKLPAYTEPRPFDGEEDCMPIDYEWDSALEMLLDDLDHTLLGMPAFDGIENDKELKTFLGAPHLHPKNWFTKWSANPN